jgi:hypothetical protein
MTRVAGVLSVVALAAACAAPAPLFDEARARGDINVLAGRIGVRPIGSAANSHARGYVAHELAQAGFAVRLQETDAIEPAYGYTAHVVNVIAVRDGREADAIALVSHYDSVPDGPGAADDALGVATCLESARVLASAPMRHSLFVIITDGEEVGLMGARAAVTDRDVAARVRAFLNFDGTGAAGPRVLFEAGPGWGAALDAWAAGAVAPRGASFAIEIYRLLPNDTDFTIFKTLGASGLNTAPVGNSYAYHTDRDVPTRIDPRTLRQGLANTIPTVRAMDGANLTSRARSPVYFDLLRQRAVVLSPGASAATSWIACALGTLTWLMLTPGLWRTRGPRLLLTPAWVFVTAAAAVGAMIGATAGVRALRAELNPWYASPTPYFVWLVVAGGFGAWLIAHQTTFVPPGLRPLRTPAAAWWVGLPVWIGLTASLQAIAPLAAYLLALPLLAAAVVVMPARRSPRLVRLASAAVGAVAIVLWADNLALLLTFFVPTFGWLGVAAPVWLYPAFISLGGVAFGPPLVAMMAGWPAQRRSSARVGLMVGGLFVIVGTVVARAPAYTADRPEMRSVRYVQDAVHGRAWWEIAGMEAAPRLGQSPLSGVAWRPSTGARSSPFIYRAETTPFVPDPPATVRSRASRTADGRLALDVSIVPHDLLVVQLELPPGVRPDESTLTGVMKDGRWSATYVAPPAAGLDVHLVFAGRSATDFQETTVVLYTSALPNAAPGRRTPAWLPNERATWRTRSEFIVSAAPTEVPAR